MGDNTFLMVFVIGFAIFCVGLYVVLRSFDKRYRSQVDVFRLAYARYSVPVTLAVMIAIGVYQSRMGLSCGEGGNDTGGWSCDLFWVLIPFLFISIALSWQWIVYSKHKYRGVLERATADTNTLPRWWTGYSRLEIVGLVIILLVALLAYVTR